MTDEELLAHLQDLEDDSADFIYGVLDGARHQARKAYFRKPYGNEEEGWSQVVTSEVQDTVEWILPQLLEIFVSTDDVVSFEPNKAEDVKGAEQATDTCNYVFTRQNDGFLVLHSVIKDALMEGNGAVMWRKETIKEKRREMLRNADPSQVALAMQDGWEMDTFSETAIVQDSETGQPIQLADVGLVKMEERKVIRIEAFEPDHLLVKRDWCSPMLDGCPYVARLMEVTLSDLYEMGFTDVVEADLGHEDRYEDREKFIDQDTDAGEEGVMARGWLRIEYVMVDLDGDGVAELRCVHRLENRILSNEPANQIPIATASPVLVPHRWDGMSIFDLVGDLQKLKTELTRQMLNSLYLANMPRTKVITDSQGSPRANIDDLLDTRPGGVVRMQSPDAVQEYVTPFIGQQTLPILEYVDAMRENRTGVTRYSQGLGSDGLEKTNGESARMLNASQQRLKLMARVFAECLIKPIFKGILKLLTEGDMQTIAYRLRNEFVEYDPKEWRDNYDMIINVGLGTGDKQQQLMHLSAIFQAQMAMMQSPLGPALVRPEMIYNTQAKMVENAGFKNVGDFWNDPRVNPPPPQQPQPPLPLMIEEMKLKADQQKFAATHALQRELEQVKAQAKIQEQQATLELQASNDQRDAEREAMVAQHKAELERMKLDLDRYKVDTDNATRIQVAMINKGANHGDGRGSEQGPGSLADSGQQSLPAGDAGFAQ